MTSEERALVVPTQVVALGTRALEVPGRGRVLCVSCTLPVLVCDAAPVAPARWYEALAQWADGVPPADATAPIPGAEVLVHGPLGPVPSAGARARLVCGMSIDVNVALAPDILTPRDDALVYADHTRAVYHRTDNPGGRKPGPGARRPVIRCLSSSARPFWFGSTPLDHPLRLRAAGTFSARPDARGWPSDADPWVLGEAHPGLRTERIDPGDRLTLDGLVPGYPAKVFEIPRYRVAITSAWRGEAFRAEPTRIHALVVLPAAGLLATVWRTAIALRPDDPFGADVGALIVAVEDSTQEPKGSEHWAHIASERWLHPDRGVDDRLLLPPALAAGFAAPFPAVSADEPIAKRHAAAREWAQRETGAPAENPFADPPALGALADARAVDGVVDAPPSAEPMADIAERVLGASRARHRSAGFDPQVRPAVHELRARGASLAAEIRTRLSRPHGSPTERLFTRAVPAPAPGSADAVAGADVAATQSPAERLARVRALSPTPVVAWDLLPPDEARTFGDAFINALGHAPSFAFLDLSGAHVVSAPGIESEIVISGEAFPWLLAETTRFERVSFLDCDFTDATFCDAVFERCTFTRCTFVRTNLSSCALVRCRFVETSWCDLSITGPTWADTRFEACEWHAVRIADVAATDLVFDGGSFDAVQMSDALWIRCTMRGMRWDDVAMLDAHAPHCLLERIEAQRLWVTGKGFSESVLRSMRVSTSGFIAGARFDRTRIEDSRFERCGFSAAVFEATVIDATSRFVECDFSRVLVRQADLRGVRFAQSLFTGSHWEDVDAAGAWFLACGFAGVDLGTVELAGAVFTDADLEVVRFGAGRTIGADFRGTRCADE